MSCFTSLRNRCTRQLWDTGIFQRPLVKSAASLGPVWRATEFGAVNANAAPPFLLVARCAGKNAAATAAISQIRSSRTVWELLERSKSAMENGALSESNVVRLLKDQRELLRASWRSISGLESLDLKSFPEAPLSVILDALLTDFKGIASPSGISVADQLAVLQMLIDRARSRGESTSHLIVPNLLYSIVQQLEETDFQETLGEKQHDVLLMLYDCLMASKRREKQRQAALTPVIARLFLLAASPSVTVDMLRIYGENQNIVDSWMSSHLCATARAHLQTQLPADTERSMRERLAGLTNCSVSFGQVAAENLNDDIASGFSLGTCAAMLSMVPISGAAELIWKTVLERAMSMSLAEVFSFLEVSRLHHSAGRIGKAELKQQVPPLLARVSALCEGEDFTWSIDDATASAECILFLRSHPVIHRLALKLLVRCEASEDILSVEDLSKLASLLAFLGIDISRSKLFSDSFIVPVPVSLISEGKLPEILAAANPKPSDEPAPEPTSESPIKEVEESVVDKEWLELNDFMV